MKDHAVIVGYGRVGGLIGEALAAQGFNFVVIEDDRRHLEELRKQGLKAVYGDAAAPGVRRPNC
jgi:CPA2 family monovalent cation:H+ antiporter-2